MRLIRQEEIDAAKNNVDSFSNLKIIFGADWLNSHFMIEDRDKKHSIFWILSNKDKCRRFSQNMGVLKDRCDKVQRIVNKLKNDIDNFESTITEVEVVSHYYRELHDGCKIDYEPSTIGKKKADIRLNINGEDYNLEILAVFEDAKDQRIWSISYDVEKQLDDIEDNPFALSFYIEYDLFSEEDIPGFVEFVKNLLIDKGRITNNTPFYFEKNGKRIAEIQFDARHTAEKGFVADCGPNSAREYDDDRRIKNKVLDKLEEQLPENVKNIVIVNLAHPMLDFYDLINAFSGQFAVSIDKQTADVKPTRLRNGLINHPSAKKLSLLIGFLGGDYSTRRYFLNGFAQQTIDPDVVEKYL